MKVTFFIDRPVFSAVISIVIVIVGIIGLTMLPVDQSQSCGAMVIEDAAQALGASFGGRSVGLHGDIGFFSLAVGKGLTTYESQFCRRTAAGRRRI